MKNITIALPEDTARWVRVRAATEDRSVSRWLAELLEGMRRRDDEYDVAMERLLAIKPQKLNWIAGRRPTREEIYDRPVLRWDRKPGDDSASASEARRPDPTDDEERGESGIR
ncbi:MAG: hypothetical protein F4Z74_01845 [Acidobacteria bacterium]|nr:hypothetical protein [Acidobacteriota bacterium]MYE42443.1 hypothetical protein [Acidobacteriota bacterium]